jgi:hypothetical protein
MGDTKTDLVRDLESKPASEGRDYILKRARAGKYHDFGSDLPAPKVQLVQDLTDGEFPDLAQKVMDGDYDDEHPTPEQEAELRESIGAEVFDSVMGKDRGES